MISILSVVFLWAQFTVLVCSSPLQESGIRHKSRNAPGPIVDLGYAKYQGSTNVSTNISSFLSIRYAAPPTGEQMRQLPLICCQLCTFNMEGSLRFQAPQAPARVNGIQKATSITPSCYQAGEGSSQTNPFIRNEKRDSTLPSEDCLFLE
jgi:hypothetical protein